MTRTPCGILILVKSQKDESLKKKKKDESSCLNIFPPPPYFSFSSLPSCPFPPFLLARGRTCGQRGPGSLSPLLTLQGRRWRKALSWADCFSRAQGSSLLATCSSPRVSTPAPSLGRSTWHSLSYAAESSSRQQTSWLPSFLLSCFLAWPLSPDCPHPHPLPLSCLNETFIQMAWSQARPWPPSTIPAGLVLEVGLLSRGTGAGRGTQSTGTGGGSQKHCCWVCVLGVG